MANEKSATILDFNSALTERELEQYLAGDSHAPAGTLEAGSVDIEVIKSQYSLADAVKPYVTLRRQGHKYTGLCPFHTEKTPSFTVNDDKAFYHCFGCGAHGDIFDFLEQMEGIGIQEVAERLTGGIYSTHSPKQLEELRTKRVKMEEAEKAKRGAAIIAARERWNGATSEVSGHPYLEKKQIKTNGARFDGSSLLIPLFGEDGKVQTLQSISPNGRKLFAPNAPVSGGLFVIGGDASAATKTILLCEGFATAASLHEATGLITICAFNSGNMRHVAQRMAQEHPDKKYLVAGDDDRGKERNPGREAAIAAAQILSCQAVFPDFAQGSTGTDFNDMAIEIGEDSVRALVVDGENHVAPIKNIVQMKQKVGDVSEDAIATTFANIHKKTLRFDHEAGRWYEWDDVRWRPDVEGRSLHYAREVVRRMTGGKRQMCKASVISGVERLCRSDPDMAVTSERWDKNLWLLGTPGGVVDLRTGQILTPDPEYNITKITTVTPESGTPKLWLSFLDDATGGDAEVISFLQEWAGYCLTGDTREHTLIFVHGGGGNGKSVFINTITKPLGDYAVTAAMETFAAARGERHSTDVAMLKGARLVTASETEEGQKWAESRIKQMTGADPITARFMRRDNFTYIPQFKLTIIGNHAPVMQNVDEAMRRRFRIVPFDKKPVNPDPQLEEKLAEEWPQILNWMIEGCLRWQRDGLSYPKAMLEATDAYFDAQDLFGQWISESCQTGKHEWETAAKLFDSWSKFAKANGEETGTSKSFGGILQKQDFKPARMHVENKRTRIYRGISVNVTQRYDEQDYRR